MITLLTGGPGAGKTAWMVDLLRKLEGQRPMYVFGLDGFKLPHEPLTDPHAWHETVPDGSVIVIDEVQQVWRARATGSKVPDHIAALETHRHKGLDFYITTQGPQLVDSNVRALVGRHIHLRDAGILGRHLYEWPECCDTCRTTGWRNAPIKHTYKLPKAAFELYKSASLHVKPVRGIPRVLFVAGFALLAFAALAWFGYRSISRQLQPPASPAPAVSPGRALPAVQTAMTGPGLKVSFTPDERVDFVPRLSDRPWTAPAYDQLRKVQAMPTITGALCVNDDCRCYHGRGRLLDVSSKSCAEWIRLKPFNAYVADDTASPSSQNPSDSGVRAPAGSAASTASGAEQRPHG